jgi:6-pyruvoyltetrahydropterin/6-carboxytetrahydropterin synthase
MHKIGKRVMFCAAHHLIGAGKCERNHGHNWEANISVTADRLDERGFIADVADIKHAAHKYDHDDLNNYFDYPSTELVCQKIAEDVLEIVKDNLGPEAHIEVHVHLVETENNTADAWAGYYGA